MNFDELMYFLVGAKSNEDQKTDYRRFREIITQAKKANCHLKAGNINPNYITADSPIPFNIRKIWYDINRELCATYKVADGNKQTRDEECLVKEGSPDNLNRQNFSHIL